MTKKQNHFFIILLALPLSFFTVRYLVGSYTHLQGYWIPITAFVVGTILAPKFQTVNTNEGEKLFMKWLFIKGFKEIK